MVSEPHTAPVFYRPGELTLLFEGNVNLDDLAPALEKDGIPINPDHPFTGPAGERRPVVLAAGRRTLGTLQTVNLTTWGGKGDPADALKQVASAVQQLNSGGLSGYQQKLLAASPNWLGLPFQ